MIRWSEEEVLLRESIRAFSLKEVAPMAKKVDEESLFPRESFNKMGELGFLGFMIPEEYGGSGGGAVMGCIILEELGKVCGSTALSVLAHTVLCAYNLYKNGNTDQFMRYLPKLCRGELIGAWCLTEPEAGSDALSLSTRAEKKGDRYIINGSKTFITNGPVADIFIILASTDPAKGNKGLSGFIIERGFKGLKVGKKIDKMGMRGSLSAEIFFEDCEVPEENLLGVEGGGLAHIMNGLDIERITISAIPLGLAMGSAEIAFKYSTERRQFGQPICNFQMIQDKIANIITGIVTSRLLLYGSARKYDEGRRVTMEAAMIKFHAAKVAVETTLEAIQILGGYGYTKDFPVERMMRDAKLLDIGAGTTEIQKRSIARQVIKYIV